MWWSSLFTDMRPSDFFNFSFLPKYGLAFVRGIEYTLLLAVVSVLLAVIPALLLAMMRLSKVKPVRWFAGASPCSASWTSAGSSPAWWHWR